ncbi:MAG TPA: ribosome maturation factor RimM [Solirubrobacteraceae bacterium]|nr:ribosome maturation factor RimM [Solirubrobacteraceae bacterium]
MQWLHAGRVGRPHGLDGSFHVTRPNAQLLRDAGRVLIEDHELEVTRRAGTDRSPILRVAGHDDRAAAEALRGKDLLVARTEAPELGPDEWWAEDLTGCQVRDGDRQVGVVRALLELPSCEVLEVQRAGGGELLVPLVSDAVREVDLDLRAIDVDLRFLGEE